MSFETLLIEIGTEELPPHHLGKLSQTLMNKICDELTALGITFDKPEYFVTPRRIATKLENVPSTQPARNISRRGPAIASAYDAKGNPTPAAVGFAKSCGVAIEALKVQETPQGSWLMFEHQEEGKPLTAHLPRIIEDALNHLPANKRMRWGDSDVEFLRPIHWVCAMHGKEALPITIFNIKATNKTYGHRFHHPQAITLSHANDYESALRQGFVIANDKERNKIILAQIEQIALKHNGTAVIEKDLLDQVTGLVEWPVPMSAQFDKTFLNVPQEALISSMQNHQKSFAIKGKNNELLPIFILVSNTEANPPDNIIKGNERVMHARLADAKFFYDQDQKTPLATRLDGLKNMVFQKKLGTLYDKCQRISKLAGLIAKQIHAPSHLCERAAKLCKADLLTEMVFEFPELQGVMGYYYALNEGESQEVALAIKESYYPRFAKDSLPQSQGGICVALADRLDTLLGIFSIGQAPTGDKDPFALRRQALAILRILIEHKLSLDLEELCQMARHGYGNLVDVENIPKVVSFCFERFRAWYLEQQVSPQTLDAVMANNPTQPYDCSLRVTAVSHFQTLSEAEHLASANKRVRNILQKSGITISSQQLPQVNHQFLKEPAEIALANTIDMLKSEAEPLIQQGKYQDALIILASLQKPVDTFFDEVMVMTEDEMLRKNRINLLANLSALFMQIADISKLAL